MFCRYRIILQVFQDPFTIVLWFFSPQHPPFNVIFKWALNSQLSNNSQVPKSWLWLIICGANTKLPFFLNLV